MKFKAVNELQQFSFEDCIMSDFEIMDTTIRFELDALIVKSNNSQNTQFMESYADTTQLRLLNASIVEGVKEGFKFYDADGNLINKVDDTPLTLDEIKDTLKRIKGCYLFAVEKKSENHYVFGFEEQVDEDSTSVVGDSYIIEFSFDTDVFEWERYLNRVQR